MNLVKLAKNECFGRNYRKWINFDTNSKEWMSFSKNCKKIGGLVKIDTIFDNNKAFSIN